MTERNRIEEAEENSNNKKIQEEKEYEAVQKSINTVIGMSDA